MQTKQSQPNQHSYHSFFLVSTLTNQIENSFMVPVKLYHQTQNKSKAKPAPRYGLRSFLISIFQIELTAEFKARDCEFILTQIRVWNWYRNASQGSIVACCQSSIIAEKIKDLNSLNRIENSKCQIKSGSRI